MKADTWFAIGKALNWSFIYDNVGNLFNICLIVLGFFGFAYWMSWQAKFNKRAANDPNQIK